jgi:hypothetical protein
LAKRRSSMTSLHKLIVLVVVWAPVPFIALRLYHGMLLGLISPAVVMALTALLVGGVVAATLAITRARPVARDAVSLWKPLRGLGAPDATM